MQNQNIIMYVSANGTLGTVRDAANAKNAASPVLTKGVAVQLHVRLFQELNNVAPYPIDELTKITAWSFVLDTDFDSDTPVKLVADNELIEIREISDIVNDEARTFTEVVIPISDMNTEELNSVLLKNESISTLTGELVGVDSEGSEIFVLQIKSFTVRNRITSAGKPTSIVPEYLTEVQTRALLRSGFDLIYSVESSSDPAAWHSVQTADDMFYRFRLAGDSREWTSDTPEDYGWSSPVKLAVGEFTGKTVEVHSLNDFGLIEVPETLPAAIEFPDGKVFPCEKDTITAENSVFLIDPAAYCAYRNISKPDFPWVIHLAAGANFGGEAVTEINGKTGAVVLTAADVGAVSLEDAAGMKISALENISSIKLVDQQVFTWTVSDGDILYFDLSELAPGRSVTMELWLAMPTVVPFTIANVTWIEDPDFSEENQVYCIVVRWNGKKLLANIAYREDLTDE